MNDPAKRPDWSRKCWKDMLVYQRKTMWRDDTLDKLAVWLNLEHGMTVADVGCGLGYLGHTFWPYLGNGGGYVGIDISPALLKDARESAGEWAANGYAEFLCGDAYALPLCSHRVDVILCQTLMMHLRTPGRALAEMVRAVRPGGLIVCIEPDNLSTALGKGYWSLPELSLDEELLFRKVYLIRHQGRVKLGLGDEGIGSKLPHMMHELNLVDVDIRLNDQVHFLEAPYDGKGQAERLEKINAQILDEPRRAILLEREEEQFIAGGGDPTEFSRFREIAERLKSELSLQIDASRYHACSAGLFYIVKGRKPAA